MVALSHGRVLKGQRLWVVALGNDQLGRIWSKRGDGVYVLVIGFYHGFKGKSTGNHGFYHQI